jgi:signal transduction histidine kinase
MVITKTENKRKTKLVQTSSCSAQSPDHSFTDINTIFSTLSHDLRSPLNTIIGFSEILLSERVGTLNEEQNKELGTILKKGSELLQLIDNLVDYCKITRHENEFQQDLVALHPFLNASLERFRSSLSAKDKEDIHLSYDPFSGPYRVVGNEQKLQLVLEQILEVGLSLFKPDRILVKVTELQKERNSRPEADLRIEISFKGPVLPDPESLFSWNDDSNIPGRVRFAMHLSRFYIRLMRGDLSVFREKGHILFYLFLCREEL